MLAYQKCDNALATDVACKVESHQEKWHGNVKRKMIFKFSFSFSFLPLCSGYLRWSPPSAAQISRISLPPVLTGFSAQRCLLDNDIYSACGQHGISPKSQSDNRTSAHSDLCRSLIPLPLKSTKFSQSVNEAGSFSFSAALPLCA